MMEENNNNNNNSNSKSSPLNYTSKPKYTSVQFEVPNNSEFCVYETFNDYNFLTMSFGIIKGRGSQVSFKSTYPNGDKIFEKKNILNELYRFTLTEIGDTKEYKFCFNSTRLVGSNSIVYFELIPYSMFTSNRNYEVAKKSTPLTEDEVKLQRIGAFLDQILDRLNTLKHYDASNKYLFENTKKQMDFWATCELVTILFVLMIQVFIIKTFFNSNREQKYQEHIRAYKRNLKQRA
jgi:hypothetical protein